jgi:hypothetical protein
VTKMPHVGETVQIRFDPDDVGDWAWGDAAMYEPARPSAQPAPSSAAPAAPAPAPQSGDPMVDFIQQAAGPWGQMPGFRGMIEGAMAANEQMMQSISGIDTSGDFPVVHYNSPPATPVAGSSESTEDTAERLKRLDKLLEQGLVTADEHRELRKKIIDSI